MSMIIHLLRVHASRRRQRKEAKREWERAILSPLAIRSRRYRRILAAVLVLIGTISFVEVVLVPGSMIRRNLPPTTPVASVLPDAQQAHQLPNWLMTDDQKAKLREEELARTEQKLRVTHLKLGNACLDLRKTLDSLTDYSSTKLQVVPAKVATTVVPPSLIDVIANEPTAQVAWARMLQVCQQTNRQLTDAREQLDLVAIRFAAGSFLEEDDQDMNAKIQQLTQSRLAVEQARSCVDHIATLQRARAALAHQATLGTTTGNPK